MCILHNGVSLRKFQIYLCLGNTIKIKILTYIKIETSVISLNISLYELVYFPIRRHALRCILSSINY